MGQYITYDSRGINFQKKIFSEANRSLDYVRILECPFGRLDYFLGMPGLYGTRKNLISVNDDFGIGAYAEGKEYFYSMQKRMALDIGVSEKMMNFFTKHYIRVRTILNVFTVGIWLCQAD